MQPWINQHPLLFAAVMLAGVAAFRWLLLTVIAAISGWKILARHFPAQQEFSGSELKWQSARLRYFVGYNNCVKVGADQTGLFIRMMWGVRVAHPPLMVPWNEVRIGQTTRSMQISLVTLTLGRSEQIPFTIRQSLAVKLHATAGMAWPGSSHK
jgi:hypothetical protein